MWAIWLYFNEPTGGYEIPSGKNTVLLSGSAALSDLQRGGCYRIRMVKLPALKIVGAAFGSTGDIFKHIFAKAWFILALPNFVHSFCGPSRQNMEMAQRAEG